VDVHPDAFVQPLGTGIALHVDTEPDGAPATPTPRRRHSRRVKSRAIQGTPSRSGRQIVPATISSPSRTTVHNSGEKSSRSSTVFRHRSNGSGSCCQWSANAASNASWNATASAGSNRAAVSPSGHSGVGGSSSSSILMCQKRLISS
jgi:hypothetical protein